MKRFVSTLILCTLGIGFAFPALSETDAPPFNPNYILSDQELEDWTSMTREDIQTFLEQRGSVLSRMRTEDKNGNRRTPADIIYRAAQEYRVNPKYLLTKLQKEQSLITDPTPTQRQFDWATGYAVCDGCGTDDPSIQRFRGFGVQVDDAAGIIRWYFDNKDTANIIKKAGVPYKIDNATVTPSNSATAFLYTYTPHLHGNQNFWTIWQLWFTGVYPDGTLIKETTDPTIYLIADGKRRPIKNMAVLISRYNPKLTLTVLAAELNRYELGPQINFPNYSILQSGDNFYLVDDDTLRPFQSEALMRKIGYQPDEVIVATPNDIEDFKIGSTITEDTLYARGRLVRLKENNAVYYIKDNQFHPVFDEQIAKINFPNLRVEKAVATDLAHLSQGAPLLFREGTLMKIKENASVYVIDHGQKRRIPTEAAFKTLGYNAKNIITVNQLIADSHPTGQPVYANTGLTLPKASL